jgi:hypothetical protein
MAKLKIRFAIEKLELEIEGEREDLPSITHGLKQQLGGMIQAPEAVMGGRVDSRIQPLAISDTTAGGQEPRSRKRRSAGSSPREASAAVDFKHDTQTWGAPKQEWNTREKAMWLLYILSKQTDVRELTHSAIAETFNKHFRQARAIRRENILRDLGKAKMQSPSLVGEDTSKSPSPWYLTQEGFKAVEQLTSKQSMSA